MAPSKRKRIKRRDRRDKRGQLNRQSVIRLGKHFLVADNTATITRLSTDNAPLMWTAIYRIDCSMSWFEVAEIMRAISEDATLTSAIGAGRDTMVNAEFELAGLGKKKGRFARKEFASLSAAYELDTSLNQAADSAADWYNRYQGAHVIGIIFFFR